jgi:gliding motility-associated transport system permease protein
MNGVVAVAKRELKSYFLTPVAYVFIVIFLIFANWLAFSIGNLYERGQADLSVFFYFHPWLFLFLVPALSMRLWAEERKSGSVELLMTLPLAPWQAVVGKFLAAWMFTAIAIVLTFPIWISINYLGNPDNGAILAAYIGSILMAGGFLAVGSCLSAVTKNQVIAFILSFVVCGVLMLAGYSIVLNVFSSWLPSSIVDGIASLGFLTHFDDISKGVIDLRDLVFFGLLIATCLYANTLILAMKQAD